jgi:hypothetical protein
MTATTGLSGRDHRSLWPRPPVSLAAEEDVVKKAEEEGPYGTAASSGGEKDAA